MSLFRNLWRKVLNSNIYSGLFLAAVVAGFNYFSKHATEYLPPTLPSWTLALPLSFFVAILIIFFIRRYRSRTFKLNSPLQCISKLAEVLEYYSNAFKQNLVIKRLQPFDFSRYTYSAKGPEHVPSDYTDKLAVIDNSLEKIIKKGAGGSEYWDYSIYGRCTNADINKETWKRISQFYFSKITKSSFIDPTNVADTSKIAINSNLTSFGIFLVGWYDEKRGIPEWKQGFLFKVHNGQFRFGSGFSTGDPRVMDLLNVIWDIEWEKCDQDHKWNLDEVMDKEDLTRIYEKLTQFFRVNFSGKSEDYNSENV